MKSLPFGRPLTLHAGLGGKVRVPYPIAFRIADDLQPRVAIAFLGDPEFSRRDGLGQMQQLRVAAEIQQDAHLPGFRFLCHLEEQGAVGRMAAHDGDEDHPVRGEVAFVERCRVALKCEIRNSTKSTIMLCP